jgi:hypothetical protein
VSPFSFVRKSNQSVVFSQRYSTVPHIRAGRLAK